MYDMSYYDCVPRVSYEPEHNHIKPVTFGEFQVKHDVKSSDDLYLPLLLSKHASLKFVFQRKTVEERK